MPELLTHGKWGCAFAVFPNIARSNHQTLCTALRGILLELQDELGAYPVPGVQRGALLAFSPWMISYTARYYMLVNGLSRYVADALQKHGICCNAVVPVRDVVDAVRFRLECTSAKDAERVKYLIDECVGHVTVSVATATATATNAVSVSLPLRTVVPNGNAVLAELPESNTNTNTNTNTSAANRRTDDPEVAPWAPTADFIAEWCPLVQDCVQELVSVLG
jgi:hypothetical protein